MEKRALMVLLKSFRQQQWAEDFLDGVLHCNSLQFYRDWEDKRLRDENEGVIVIPGAKIDRLTFGNFRIPKSDLVSLSYRPNLMDYVCVYCMYCWAPPWVDDERVFLDKETQLGSLRRLERCYGRYSVVIQDLPEFFRRLNQVINSPYSEIVLARGTTVRYERMLALPTTPEQTLDAVFHKDKKYIGEQEYRLAFLLSQKKQGAFRMNIGSIRDIAVMMRTKDIFDSIRVNGQSDF